MRTIVSNLIWTLFLSLMIHAEPSEFSTGKNSLAPISFVKKPSAGFMADHSPASIQKVIPGYRQFKAKILKKYSKASYSEKLRQAFEDLDKADVYVVDAVTLKSSGFNQLYGFNQKSSPSDMLLPDHCIGMARELYHFQSLDFIRACFLFTAMKPYGKENEISEIIREIYPEIFLETEDLSLEKYFSRKATRLAFYAETAASRFISSVAVFTSDSQPASLSFKDWLLAGLGRDEKQYQPRSMHEVRSTLKKAFSTSKGLTPPAVMQAVLNVFLDPENQDQITEQHIEQLILLTSDIELPISVLDYISRYLNNHENLSVDLIRPSEIRIIKMFLQILCSQVQYGSSLEYIRIRSMISRWAYHPNGLKDIKNIAESLGEKMETILGERLSRYHGLSDTRSLQSKISHDWKDEDIERFYQKYEFKDHVSFESYRTGFRTVYEQIVKTLLDQETDIVRKSVWMLEGGKVLDVSKIRHIRLRFVGEGGAKITLVAEIIAHDGDVSHIIFKGFKPVEVQFKRSKLVSVKGGFVQEMYRHQYMSGHPNTSIFGIEVLYDLPVWSEEYFPDVRVDDYLRGIPTKTIARLDEFLKPVRQTPEELEIRKDRWHKAACAVFTRLFTMAFMQGEWLDDPKPSNFMMFESMDGHTKRMGCSLFDVGEIDPIAILDRMDQDFEKVLLDLVGPTGQDYKGIEELYPELKGVGYTEAAIALDTVFRGNKYLLSKFFKTNQNFSSKFLNHLPERLIAIHDLSELKSIERILAAFPPELNSSRKYSSVMELIRSHKQTLLMRQLSHTMRDQLSEHPESGAA
ncbi:MAG: hypothetical protein JW774_08995 [Candidatus Aureabacteria bacterium]|nr:hypothetical protein [Candidatus Auribacterota bacterium]